MKYFLSFQFDLQRMMIYCDAKHAELETCCDLPAGPVSMPAVYKRGLYYYTGYKSGIIKSLSVYK